MFPGFKIEDHDKFRDIYDFLVAKSKNSEDERERTLSFASFEFKNPHRLFVEYSSKPQNVRFGLHRYFTSKYVKYIGFYAKLRGNLIRKFDLLELIKDFKNYDFSAIILCIGFLFLFILALLYNPLFSPLISTVISIALMEFALYREITSLKEGVLIEAYSDKEFFHELVESKELVVISYVNSESFELS
ncbi:hypothetical protein [Vibrio metschnikovii]|uniref:Uncharacterized protein n=1 Tax=Vibrio metschnikovii TaxID=28172 RepID=A0A9X0R8G2_VIBME|nr:hypothetical protein [Vibrio metschnikovii]MBC5851457.1 hypothetical protein [Vibrio metschnikovii]